MVRSVTTPISFRVWSFAVSRQKALYSSPLIKWESTISEMTMSGEYLLYDSHLPNNATTKKNYSHIRQNVVWLLVNSISRTLLRERSSTAFWVSRDEEIPFSSETKMMLVRVHPRVNPDEHLIFAKGALEVVLERCR